MAQTVALGCIICGRPAVFHHIRFHVGGATKASNYLGIPLCDSPPDGHHKNGRHGTAFHAGRVAFEKRHGTELELLERVYARLKKPWPPKELTILIEKNNIRKSSFLS
jgi:hypothetical protein